MSSQNHESMRRWLDARGIDEIDPGEFPESLKGLLAGKHMKKRMIYVGCTPGEKPLQLMSEVLKCVRSLVTDDRLSYSSRTAYPLLSFNMGRALDRDFSAAAILIGDDGQEVLYPGMRFPFVFASPGVGNPEGAMTTRIHNCSTMLGIGADYVAPEEAAGIARAWIEAEFDPYRDDGDIRLRRYLECVKFGLDAGRAGVDVLLRRPARAAKKLILFSDHRGYLVKEFLKGAQADSGYQLVDVGTSKGPKERCDYPLFAASAAWEMVSGSCEGSRAVGICGSGIGAAAAAKMWGVYGAMCTDEDKAAMARLKYDANLLTLPAGDGSPAAAERAVRIVDCFLSTGFDAEGAGIYRDKMLQKEQEALRTIRERYNL